MLLVDNLYQNIIENNAKKSTELRIISGYGSSKFLKSVKDEFPSLEIVLFLGMTSEGISKENHESFKELMRLYGNIHVYYQIKGPPTHMKVVEFLSLRERKTYIGSANFTENGFMRNREVMTLVENSAENLFLEQMNASLICTDNKIEDFINFYEEGMIREAVVIEENPENYKLKKGKGNSNQQYIKMFHQLKTQYNPTYYDIFDLEIVLHVDNNPRWENTGINAWMTNKPPTLMQTPRLLFDTIFPVGQEFEIYSDIGEKYLAKLSGRFNSHLTFIDGNIYEYVKEKINLVEKRPIRHEDLINYGNTKIHFERVDELKYLMIFRDEDTEENM